MNALTETQQQMLDFAGRRYGSAGRRAADIRTLFDLSETVFSLRVQGLLEREDALAYSPATVNRLRRLREARQLVRTAAAELRNY